MSNDSRPSVIVIGGGLAGLAAASALAPRGFRVTLLESRNRLGGRAGSFTEPETGQVIDACQHVSMGCCTNFAHFCKTVGIDHLLAPQPTLWFMTPDRRISRFEADRLPAPFHLTRSLLRAHYLTLGDKVRIGWGMLQLLRSSKNPFPGPSPKRRGEDNYSPLPASERGQGRGYSGDDQPLLPWLKKNRQNERTIERFWAVVLVSALNESIDRVGLKYARKVFRDAFLGNRHGHVVSVPIVPLSRFYGDEMLAWFAKQRVAIENNARVRRLDIESDRVRGVQLRDGRSLAADWYVLAIPFDRVTEALPPDIAQAHSDFRNLGQLTNSPITSIHCWFDRPVMNLPHLVLVDCLGQWVFNRGEIAPGEHYLQVVVSASRLLTEMGQEGIRERIVAELKHLFPIARQATLLRSRVVTENRATFAPLPGVDRWRPGQETPIRNLMLAGDWTATDWPATMEGAVRSGYLAAAVILRKIGSSA